MYWQGYLEDTGHAIQKGLSQGMHILWSCCQTLDNKVKDMETRISSLE